MNNLSSVDTVVFDRYSEKDFFGLLRKVDENYTPRTFFKKLFEKAYHLQENPEITYHAIRIEYGEIEDIDKFSLVVLLSPHSAQGYKLRIIGNSENSAYHCCVKGFIDWTWKKKFTLIRGDFTGLIKFRKKVEILYQRLEETLEENRKGKKRKLDEAFCESSQIKPPTGKKLKKTKIVPISTPDGYLGISEILSLNNLSVCTRYAGYESEIFPFPTYMKFLEEKKLLPRIPIKLEYLFLTLVEDSSNTTIINLRLDGNSKKSGEFTPVCGEWVSIKKGYKISGNQVLRICQAVSDKLGVTFFVHDDAKVPAYSENTGHYRLRLLYPFITKDESRGNKNKVRSWYGEKVGVSVIEFDEKTMKQQIDGEHIKRTQCEQSYFQAIECVRNYFLSNLIAHLQPEDERYLMDLLGIHNFYLNKNSCLTIGEVVRKVYHQKREYPEFDLYQEHFDFLYRHFIILDHWEETFPDIDSSRSLCKYYNSLVTIGETSIFIYPANQSTLNKGAD